MAAYDSAPWSDLFVATAGAAAALAGLVFVAVSIPRSPLSVAVLSRMNVPRGVDVDAVVPCPAHQIAVNARARSGVATRMWSTGNCDPGGHVIVFSRRRLASPRQTLIPKEKEKGDVRRSGVDDPVAVGAVHDSDRANTETGVPGDTALRDLVRV